MNAWKDQSLDIVLVYLNILEYCKSMKISDLYWEKNFEFCKYIKNAYLSLMKQTGLYGCAQFNERLSLKSMTKSFKSSLMEMAKFYWIWS